MEKAKPLYDPIVHFNQSIVLVFGEPVEYRDILDAWKRNELTREEARIQITQRFYDAIENLERKYRAMQK